MANRLINYFTQHYDDLIVTAVRITRNVADAEDVMQNVAVALCKRDSEAESVGNCGAFIAVCIRRAAISMFRHRSHEQVTDPYFLEIYQERAAESEANDRSGYAYAEWVSSLESHLGEYPEEMRNAFIAHYVDGVPLETLGEQLGLSVKALSGRFARMRKALKNSSRSMFDQFNVLILF